MPLRECAATVRSTYISVLDKVNGSRDPVSTRYGKWIDDVNLAFAKIPAKIKGRLANIRLSSFWGLLAGVVLLAVPTVFTLFGPEIIDRESRRARYVILAVWLLVAAFVGLITLAKDRAWDLLVTKRFEQRQAARLSALDDALKALLRPGTKDFPPSYIFVLYLPDDGELTPFFPKFPAAEIDLWTFESGNGATGEAWLENTTIEVHGTAVSDGTHRLNPAQQAFFAPYHSVVATPVTVDDEQLGVLTGLSPDDDRFFAADTAQAALRELADTLGVLMEYVPQQSDLVWG